MSKRYKRLNWKLEDQQVRPYRKDTLFGRRRLYLLAIHTGPLMRKIVLYADELRPARSFG